MPILNIGFRHSALLYPLKMNLKFPITSLLVLAFNNLFQVKPNSLKYLVLDHFQVSQDTLKNTFENFYRKRDYYRILNRTVSPYWPGYLTIKAISTVLNVSVISTENFQNDDFPKQEYAYAYLAVWTYSGAPYTLQKIMDLNANSKEVAYRLKIVPMPILDFNFVYCDVPTLKTDVPWNMQTLTFSFETNVWVSILTSMAAVAITFKLKVKEVAFLDTSFLVLRSLFPDNMDAHRKFLKTPFLYLWIVITFVLSNYYAGILTSVVISPPKENSFSYIAELVKNNFTILFDSQVNFDTVSAIVRYYSRDTQNEDVLALNGTLDFTGTKVRILNDVVNNGSELPIELTAKLLSTNRKVASVNFWQSCIAHLNNVNKLFGNMDPHKRPVHCKRLIPAAVIFQMYLTPRTVDGRKLERVIAPILPRTV